MAYTINAVWDGEAEVWVATSDDVPGLATEAASREALVQKLRAMARTSLSTRTSKSRHTANAVLKQAGLPKQF